jgi:hypothetical protein
MNVPFLDIGTGMTGLEMKNVLIQSNICQNQANLTEATYFLIKFYSLIIQNLTLNNNNFCPGIILTN